MPDSPIPTDATAEPGSTDDHGGVIGPWPTDGAPGASSVPGGATSLPSTGPTTALADLASYQGERVTIGGTVTAIDGARLTVDDGSSIAVIRLVGDAGAMASLVAIGDLVNATGVVDRNADGGVEVAVDDPAAFTWLAAIEIGATPFATANASPDPSLAPAVLSDTEGLVDATAAAVAVLLVASVLLLGGALAATPRNRARLRAWLSERPNRAQKEARTAPRKLTPRWKRAYGHAQPRSNEREQT